MIPIYVRVTIDGLAAEISLGCRVLAEQWDNTNKMLLSYNLATNNINKKIRQEFAYRISMGAGVFILAGVKAVAITFIAVSVQSIVAAMANPVTSLSRSKRALVRPSERNNRRPYQ